MTAGKLRILFVDLSNVCRCARRLLYIHCSLQQCASLLIVGTTLHKFLAEIIPGRSFWWSQVAGLRGHLSQLGTEGGPPRPVHHQLMQHRRSAALRPSRRIAAAVPENICSATLSCAQYGRLGNPLGGNRTPRCIARPRSRPPITIRSIRNARQPPPARASPPSLPPKLRLSLRPPLFLPGPLP